MEEKPDTHLVALAKDGDKSAFARLAERYASTAERIAVRLAGDPDVGRELANEALLQAYLSLDRLRDATRFGSWLYGIVLNVWRSHIRARGQQTLSLEALYGGVRLDLRLAAQTEPDPQEMVDAKELHQMIRSTVDMLSPKIRAAVLLYYYEQLTVREIAATLNVSTAAVKGRLHRARERLRHLMAPLVHEDSTQPATEKEEKVMIPVKIVDVVHQQTKLEGIDHPFQQCVVILLGEEGQRVLPIWLGEAEGRAIVLGLKNTEVPRPLTYHFVASLLEAGGLHVEEIRVQGLREDTYYAIVRLRVGQTIREVDCRPSDAFGLGVQVGCPIAVAEDVMEKAAVAVPQEFVGQQPLGVGIESIVQEMSQRIAYYTQQAEEAKSEDHHAVWEEHMSDLVSQLYGQDE